jgi:uncharacterized protein
LDIAFSRFFRLVDACNAIADDRLQMTQRLVLDTNVWIDWLVFDDPSIAPLAAAQTTGEVALCIDADCETELARALAYRFGRVSLDEEAQVACLARCRALVEHGWKRRRVALRLPDCRDPDDQKFLALALACGAQALITRDRALLETGRRWKKTLPFAIATPRAWAAHRAR